MNKVVNKSCGIIQYMHYTLSLSVLTFVTVARGLIRLCVRHMTKADIYTLHAVLCVCVCVCGCMSMVLFLVSSMHDASCDSVRESACLSSE